MRDVLRDRRVLAQELCAAHEQIVKVERVVRAQPRLVHGVHLGEGRLVGGAAQVLGPPAACLGVRHGGERLLGLQRDVGRRVEHLLHDAFAV